MPSVPHGEAKADAVGAPAATDPPASAGGRPAAGLQIGAIQGVDDPLLWVAIVSAALSGFFSLNGYALRRTSRRDLEAAFAARSSRHLGSAQEKLPDLQLVCALLRTVFNLTLLVALLELLAVGESRVLGIVGAVALAAGIISIFVVAIPHAWANYAGA